MNNLRKKISLLLFAVAATLPIQKAHACNEPFLAGMCVFSGNFAPRGFAFAQGQILPINSNQSLYSLLGTTYGGDGRTSFALPDLRGRVAIGAGAGAGLTPYSLGAKGGSEFITLSVSEIPLHNHDASTIVTGVIDNVALNDGSSISMHAISSTANRTDPSGSSLAIINARRSGYYTSTAPNVTMATEAATVTVTMAPTTATAITTVTNTGGASHENRMPYIAMNWIIAIEGLFPSRN